MQYVAHRRREAPRALCRPQTGEQTRATVLYRCHDHLGTQNKTPTRHRSHSPQQIRQFPDPLPHAHGPDDFPFREQHDPQGHRWRQYCWVRGNRSPEVMDKNGPRGPRNGAQRAAGAQKARSENLDCRFRPLLAAPRPVFVHTAHTVHTVDTGPPLCPPIRQLLSSASTRHAACPVRLGGRGYQHKAITSLLPPAPERILRMVAQHVTEALAERTRYHHRATCLAHAFIE